MKEFNKNLKSATCDKCGHNPQSTCELNTIRYKNMMGVENLVITCPVCGYSCEMKCSS